MTTNRAQLPPIADPTIDQIFEEFLTAQGQRLKPKTLSKYRSIISLLRHHLDGYGYEGLSKEESALFEWHHNAEGDAHKEFCQIFGPEHTIPNLGMFLSYFMVRKVMAGAELKRSAGTVTKKLSKWLAQRGYIAEQDAVQGAEKGSEAARALPAAERAAQILAEAGDLFFDPSDLPDDDYMEFDHFTIGRIEPGKLWLKAYISGEGVVGPIAVPRKATDILQENWEISCALARVHGKWRLVEVANVYPH